MPSIDDTQPLSTLADWVEDARDAGLPEHDAAVLATVGPACRPTARIVSLRRVEAGALVFTTATWTRKARDMEANPDVAFLFHWPALGRQVHVGGPVERAERALAEEIFAARDRPHQLQSLVSRQGEPVADLAPLRERLADVRRTIGDGPVPCPDDWAAFRMHPLFVEYWSASADALHDGVLYRRDGDRWSRARLAP